MTRLNEYLQRLTMDQSSMQDQTKPRRVALGMKTNHRASQLHDSLKSNQELERDELTQSIANRGAKMIIAGVDKTQKSASDLKHSLHQLCVSKIESRDKYDALCVSLQHAADSIIEANEEAQKSLLRIVKRIGNCQEALDVSGVKLQAVSEMNLAGLIEYCIAGRKQFKGLLKNRDEKMKMLARINKNNHNHNHTKMVKNGRDDYTKMQKKITETRKAKEESLKVDNDLIEAIQAFEGKRFRDLHKFLKDFILLELDYHSKSLESFSECYKDLIKWNYDADLLQRNPDIKMTNGGRFGNRDNKTFNEDEEVTTASNSTDSCTM